MKIAVVGATGRLGGAVAREATARGHQVTALSSSNMDAADPASAEARDTPIADEKGESRISVGDYAAAVIDALENESFIHARFTVAY